MKKVLGSKQTYFYIILLVNFIFNGFSIADTKEEYISEPFRGHTLDSKLTINYSDLSKILNLAVFDVGRSFREKSKTVKGNIGSRLKSSRKVYTSLEGNRFYFSVFKEPENKERLINIRNSLQGLPDEMPLKMFDRREQLAYWLNLYNVTLLSELVNVSQSGKIGDDLYDSDGILNKMLLTVSGIKLSLNDIQFKIVYPKFDYKPSLMYGFYQGVIGGPNIRTSAYRAKDVNQQLDSNAEEFINSNRGTFRGRKQKIRVSKYYEISEKLFPDFDNDLKKHLLNYAIGDYEYWINEASSFKPNIKDMHIANIRAGERSYNSSAATSAAAMLDSAGFDLMDKDGAFSAIVNSEFGGGKSVIAGIDATQPGQIADRYAAATKSMGVYSVEMMELLAKLKSNSRIRHGTVEVKQEREVKNYKEDQE